MGIISPKRNEQMAPLCSELYDMEDYNKLIMLGHPCEICEENCHDCERNNCAFKLLTKLRKKIELIRGMYCAVDKVFPGRLLSARQICTSENAIMFLRKGWYICALREVYDFLDNYKDNDHELTSSEYAMLNVILSIMQNGYYEVEDED